MESNVLELTPPLIMSEKESNLGLEILDKAFEDVSKGLVSDETVLAFKGW
jgi:4-aminobutyrate aminotransferase